MNGSFSKSALNLSNYLSVFVIGEILTISPLYSALKYLYIHESFNEIYSNCLRLVYYNSIKWAGFTSKLRSRIIIYLFKYPALYLLVSKISKTG